MYKPTTLLIEVTPEAAADVERYVRKRLEEPWEVVGPRGGRYLAVGPVTIEGPRPMADVDPHAWMQGNKNLVFAGRRKQVRRVRK